MRKTAKRTAIKSFEKDDLAIVKDTPTLNQEWVGTGDAFVKFSLYEHQPTVAKPFTTLTE